MALPQETNTVRRQPKYFRTTSFQQATNSYSAVDELKLYLGSICAIPTVNPLDWWRCNTDMFPKLSKIARFVLAIPATSAASERVFSRARLVMPWNRCRLSPSTLRAIMCLRDWLQVIDDHFETELLQESLEESMVFTDIYD
jgi:hypothetical protein